VIPPITDRPENPPRLPYILAGDPAAAVTQSRLPRDACVPGRQIVVLNGVGSLGGGAGAHGAGAPQHVPHGSLLVALTSADLVVATIRHSAIMVPRVAVMFDVTGYPAWDDRRIKVLVADVLARRTWDAEVVWYPTCDQSRMALMEFADRIEIAAVNWPLMVETMEADVREPGSPLPPVVGFLATAAGYLHDEEIALCLRIDEALPGWRQRWLARPDALTHLHNGLPNTVPLFASGEMSVERFLWSIDVLLLYPEAPLSALHAASVVAASGQGTIALGDPQWLGTAEGLVIPCPKDQVVERLETLWSEPAERRRIVARACHGARSGCIATADATAWFDSLAMVTPA